MDLIIKLTDEIHFNGCIGFKIESGSEELRIKLESLFKKKRLPVELNLEDYEILLFVEYEIDEENFSELIRKCVRGGLINKDFEDLVFNIINEKIETVLKDHDIHLQRTNCESVNGSKRWNVPKSKLTKKLNEYYKSKRKEYWNKTSQLFNSYFELPCVKSLYNMGGIKGKRNHGAKIIAFACINEGISKEEALKIGKQYHKRIGSDDFPLKEVIDWINWVYSKDSINWTCRAPQGIGECDKSVCWVVKKYYENKEENSSEF